MGLRQLRRNAWLIICETCAEWKADRVSILAAALAYYTIFSLAPLLVFVIAIAGFFFGQERVQTEISQQLQQFFGSEGAEFVQRIIENIQASDTDASLTASLTSIGLLFIGATGVFAHLQNVLNIIWDVKPPKAKGWFIVLRARVLSFSMVLGIGFLLLVSLVISTALNAVEHFAQGQLPNVEVLPWQAIDIILSYGITTVMFAMIFKFLPDAKVYWRDVWVGSVVTTILFSIGEFLLGFYISRSGFRSTYGAAGSLVVLIAWIYYSAQILFIGAEFTEVYARHYGVEIQSARVRSQQQ